jgi:hypothetical protein
MQQKAEDVNRMQAAQTPKGEPILSELRSVVARNGSKYANIPAAADRIVSFEDQLEIRIFHDHIEIWPEGDNGE